MTTVDKPAISTLKTSRLLLRPFRESDWKDAHVYASDPEISQFQGWGPNSESDTKNFVRRCIFETLDPIKPVYFFSVARLDDDVHIGGFVLAFEGDEATIGYTISRAEWAKGYATEAATAVIGFAFDHLGVQKVVANCDVDNVGSWKVMEKIGMHLEKTIKNARYSKGRWRDWYEYSISSPTSQAAG